MTTSKNISVNELYAHKDNYKRIFFYRICGTGMGAGAVLLKELGKEIEGCDRAFYPPMSTYLKSTRIVLHSMDKVSIDLLKTFDLVVIGNVVPREGEFGGELVEKSGVAYCSLPDALSAFVLKDKNVVGIAGTHGKTTTTYLMAQIFENLGQNPGHLIGGVLDDRPPARLGGDHYFFIEADEYDSAYFQKISKFRLYSIDHLILTSLEFDHGDIFSDLTAIENEFERVIPEITKSFIVNTDYPSLSKFYQKYAGQKQAPHWYSYGENSKTGPTNIKMDHQGSQFSLNIDGREVLFKTNLIGKQNILNLTSCILFALHEKFELEKIQQAVQKLDLVKRRQEVRGFYKGAIVVDDFAHHPRAVGLTIDSMRAKYPQKHILTVFEPNSYTARSPIFQNEFADGLALADSVIATLPLKKGHIKDKGQIDCFKLVQDIKSKGDKDAHVAKDLLELRNLIDNEVNSNCLLLILSNGTCLGLWESDFVNEITKN